MITARRLAVTLSLLTYMTVAPAISSDQREAYQARLTYDKAQKEVREKRLSGALTDILGMEVQVRDDMVVLKGSQTHIHEALKALNDFNVLREKVVPLNPEKVHTQATQSTEFKNWHECMIALGIQPELMSNFAVHANLDEAGTLKIPYAHKPDQMLANVYIETLREQSPYLDWICKHNHEVITEAPQFKIINYGLLKEYMCKLEVQQEPTEVPEVFQTQLPVTTVLKRLTAAAGEDLSLVTTSQLGHYQVRTVMLGRADTDQHVSAIPNIDVLVDYSTSMNEPSGGSSGLSKIEVVNASMPNILKLFRDSLKPGETLKVKVKKFNHELANKDHDEYTLIYADQSPIQWKQIVPSGGTNLTIIGKLLKLDHPDQRKLILAFTDGKHETHSSPIQDSLKELQEVKASGLFADLNLHRVGVKEPEHENYFPYMSAEFDGVFEEHATMEQYTEKVTRKLPYLFESKTPILLKITPDAKQITIRVPDAHPDIHTTEQTVNVQSVVTHRGVEHFIVPKKPGATSAASSVATTVSAVDEKEALLAQMREIEAKLAALNTTGSPKK